MRNARKCAVQVLAFGKKGPHPSAILVAPLRPKGNEGPSRETKGKHKGIANKFDDGERKSKGR